MANKNHNRSVLKEDECATLKNMGLQTEHSETAYVVGDLCQVSHKLETFSADEYQHFLYLEVCILFSILGISIYVSS